MKLVGRILAAKDKAMRLGLRPVGVQLRHGMRDELADEMAKAMQITMTEKRREERGLEMTPIVITIEGLQVSFGSANAILVAADLE